MRSPSRFLLVSLVGLCALSGCDNSLDPLADNDQFSIYGTLSMNTSRQVVRVRGLGAPFTPEATRELDVDVHLVREDTGERFPMRDVVVAFDSVYTHNFIRSIDVAPDTRYRLIVERPDGQHAHASTRTPPLVQPEVTPSFVSCTSLHTVEFPGVTDQSLLRAKIGYRYEGTQFWVYPDLSQYATASDGTLQVRFRPESVLGSEVPTNDNPKTIQYESRCPLLDDEFVSVVYVHFGPEGRTSDGPYDPSQSSLVENGRGMLGAMRRDTIAVAVPRECGPGLLC